MSPRPAGERRARTDDGYVSVGGATVGPESDRQVVEGDVLTGLEISPVCRAPSVALEFDPSGDVQACCANALYPLGSVTRSSVREIWEGEPARKLRAALAAGDLSYGCHVCRHRLSHGYGDLARDYYEHFPLAESNPEWPYSLQFSLHNTCNLACVMCGSDRSSRIRSRRDRLPPLPHVYGDRFFEEIEPFIAHAGAVDLSGGEPFLVAEHARIWDILIGLDPAERPLCSLTTNGTIWNAQTERVLAELDTHIAISIDGMTRETFESIRVGASFDTVLANLDRFLGYTRERGTILTMGWCLLQQNWHEFALAARFAEERGIELKVLTVIEPDFGVQQLPTEELVQVIDALDLQGRYLLPDLVLNRAMWEREVDRLRDEVARRARPGVRALTFEPPSPANLSHVMDFLREHAGGADRRPASLEDSVAAAVESLRDWNDDLGLEPLRLRLTEDLQIIGSSAERLVVDARVVAVGTGSTLAGLLDGIGAAVGFPLWVGEEHVEPDRVEHTLWFGSPSRDKAGLIVRLITFAEEDGFTLLMALDDRLLAGPGNRPWPRSLVGGGARSGDGGDV